MAEGKTITIIQKGKAPEYIVTLTVTSVLYESSVTLRFTKKNSSSVYFDVSFANLDRNVPATKPFGFAEPGTYDISCISFAGDKCAPGVSGKLCGVKRYTGYLSQYSATLTGQNSLSITVTDRNM